MIPFGLSPLRFWLYLGAAAIVCGALTFGGCEHANAKSARADRDSMEAERDYAKDSAKSKDVVIVDIGKSRDAWKALATPTEEMEAAGDRAEQLERNLNQTRAALDRLAREKDRALPECDALLRTDFEIACPARAQRLRDRSDPAPDIFR